MLLVEGENSCSDFRGCRFELLFRLSKFVLRTHFMLFCLFMIGIGVFTIVIRVIVIDLYSIFEDDVNFVR